MPLLLSQGLQVPGARCLAPGELLEHREERFAWALSRGHALAALACEPLGLEGVERQEPGITPRVLGALALGLEPAFRASEAIVQSDEGRLVVLLVGPDPLRMEAACREWIAGAREIRIDGLASPLRVGLWLGYGVTQTGQRMFLDTLLQVAFEGLRVARCRGPGACVHTMLYELLQDRFERERGAQGLVVTANAAFPPGAPPREPTRAPPREPTRERTRDEALPPVVAGGDPEASAAQPESAQDRIELLERRLAKLTLSLAEAEERLARAELTNAVDSGIASRHRTFQGLDPDAPHHALKASLMEKLFVANLELRASLQLPFRQVS